jgi:prepilin-type N-terminal cleavage/methylation domain-containing protein
MKKKILGFTLIEILVVISIISVLSGVIYANFNSARESSRDKVRQTSLKELQLAIELYKSQYGMYPEAGCGGGTSWTGPSLTGSYACGNEYIVGLVPEFLSELPVDPQQNGDQGFLYSVSADRSAYKALVFRTVEREFVTDYDHPFARCPRDFGTAECGSSPQPDTYSIYSRGKEGS